MYSEPLSSEVLDIFYSMTYEYKPKSAGLSSILFNCKEREGDDLPTIQLLRNFHLVCRPH